MKAHTRLGWARQGVAWLVAALLVLQALLAPAQRTAARAHFHLPRLPAVAVEAPRIAAASPTGLFRHKRDTLREDHDAAHRHTHSAVHEHLRDLGDVVHVDGHEAGSASSTVPPSKRLALDLDAALRREPVQARAVPLPAPDGAWVLSFSSHTEPPLERPPRVGT